MASRYFNQFVSTLNFNPVYLEGSFQIGASGAVQPGSVVGSGMPASSTLSVQKKGTGIYEIQLDDPYSRFLGASFTMLPQLSGQAVVDGAGGTTGIIIGKAYQIVTASTSTNWYTLGLPTNLNPTIGMPFVATSGASNVPASSVALVGSGTMAPIGVCSFDHIEVLPDVNLELAPTSGVIMDNGPGMIQSNNGSILWIQTIKSSSGAPVNPSSGTTIRFNLMLRNSSRGGYNESSTAN